MRPLCLLDADSPNFPARLLTIPQPPRQLWTRGNLAALPSPATPSIAIVGSRSATRDGLAAATEIAAVLAGAGLVVVSGLARGVDSAAHRATLTAGGQTIAVLGSGLDRIYPPEHVGLAAEIAERGVLVSEYPPELSAHRGTFPRRNRLIAGLADVVLVVEAPEKSGSLITASAALEQGKGVMVVPGRSAGGRNRGGHLLIRDGATLVESAADILAELGCAATMPHHAQLPELVEFTVDDLVAATGQTPAGVLADLLQLELAGTVQRCGAGRFVRAKGRVLT